MSVLSIEDLCVTYSTSTGDLRALRNVTLDVPRERIVGLVGESGCGKSTLINAILGLLAANGRIDHGRILFQGRNIAELSADELRAMRGPGIATVFQDPMGALNPVFRIGRQMINIQYRSKLSRAEKANRAAETLRSVRIPDAEAALKRYPHEFSGGMKQRIAIAMALMMKPAILIADEPTTALDATLEVATIELLQELQRDIGCSMLFISHHMGVIAELCDDVVVMYAGEVVESGTTRQVFLQPRHPYTRNLIRCDPARQHTRVRQLPTIPGDLPNLRSRPRGCIFAPRCEMRKEICEEPPPQDVSNGHMARCHLAVEH
ncbi:MAG: ABC transporter ATP-binding protein [Rhodobacteraceae bacterium]|nr:ABC transporter ATP-binding protein [Paracoccaceae bacterium]